MYLKVFAFFLCLTYVACDRWAPSVDCENTTIHSSNNRMEVSGCHSDLERCPLYRGTNHTVMFTFMPSMDFMNKTYSRIYGMFDKFSVPYGKRGDACDGAVATDDGTHCKDHGGFLMNREYKHTSKFSVSNNYPLLDLKVRFVFYDKRSKEMLMCREVPVEIKPGAQEENQS